MTGGGCFFRWLSCCNVICTWIAAARIQNMKILCVSDQIDPLIYSDCVKENFGDVDLVLCAGDLPMDYVDFIVTTLNKPTFFVFGNHDLKEYKYYHGEVTNTINGPQVDMSIHTHGATYASMKSFVCKYLQCDNKNENVSATLLMGSPCVAKLPAQGRGSTSPLIIVGISGSIRYNNGLCQYTDMQMFFRLLFLVPRLLYNKLRYGKFLDIFLTHAAPRGIHDKNDPCHKGFWSFNWFLKKFKPRLMVHGHIHLYDIREERFGQYFDTMIVNAYAYCLVEL